MQLAGVSLRNFRSCRETSVRFAPDLTVVVGENASGKTAIVDALRLVTFPASGRQTAWFSVDRDLSYGVNTGTPVDISARYSQLTDDEKGIFLAELVEAHDDLVYTASFATDADVPRRSILTWGVGDARLEDPEPALRRRIAHVYLPPLRDAVRDLDGGDQALLHDVLRIVVGADEDLKRGFVETANGALKQIADHELAVSTKNAIQSFFARTTPPNREHVIELNECTLEMRRIARLLRIQLAERQVPIGDIAATGLGYANLLYIAMIVLQLVRARDSDLTLLLVEEPEAHLHPQLQLVLLDFLHSHAKSSGKPVSGPHAVGKVQVIVTTHSPVLASTVSVKNVVVVARHGEHADWCTKATAIADLGLKDIDRRKIDRYLNSTRSALLFARDVVLVEGIAEMLVLPVCAQRHLTKASAGGNAKGSETGAPNIDNDSTAAEVEEGEAAAKSQVGVKSETTDPDDNRVRKSLRQFRSATLINVEGVDFEPYLRVLLDGDHPRVDRVVVITDRDHTGAGDTRKAHYEALFQGDVDAGRLKVVVGGTTLEAEIFRLAENEEVLRSSFLKLHSQSKHHWDNVVEKAKNLDQDQRAELFARAIRAESAQDEVYLDIAKGDFAHVVAEALEQTEDTELLVPDYLRQAIEAVAYMDPQCSE